MVSTTCSWGWGGRQGKRREGLSASEEKGFFLWVHIYILLQLCFQHYLLSCLLSWHWTKSTFVFLCTNFHCSGKTFSCNFSVSDTNLCTSDTQLLWTSEPVWQSSLVSGPRNEKYWVMGEGAHLPVSTGSNSKPFANTVTVE